MYIDRQKLPDILRHDTASLNRLAVHLSGGIGQYFRQSGFRKAVIGLSGGIDSAVAAALGVMALGPENVIAVRLPFRQNNERSLAVAEEIAERIGLPAANRLTLDITKAVETAWSSLVLQFAPSSEEQKNIRLGNLAARERMKALMDIASHVNGLVLGTENRTEEILAYFTIGGDSVSNLEPIQSLWKVEVFQLAEHLRLPDSVLNRAPSAELWSGQTDEDDLGSYLVADTVLAGLESIGADLNDPAAWDSRHRETVTELFGIQPQDYDRVVSRAVKMCGKRHAPGRIGRS